MKFPTLLTKSLGGWEEKYENESSVGCDEKEKRKEPPAPLPIQASPRLLSSNSRGLKDEVDLHISGPVK